MARQSASLAVMAAYKWQAVVQRLGRCAVTGYAGRVSSLEPQRVRYLLSMFFCLAVAGAAQANESADESAAPQTLYYALTPAMVGNYASGERLKYFKADVALRISSKEVEDRVKHHEPLIRHQLVMLFSEQTDETLGSVEAKELLRQEALKQVREVLEQEEGKPLVDDLLFNNLIIQ
ncbi:flagellar basal body-associated protein FliL-like protein [Streptococcus pneumoniae]|nr:flagellar basal body-associated protein FliL-like protein [Streptococcus pneumoniae]